MPFLSVQKINTQNNIIHEYKRVIFFFFIQQQKQTLEVDGKQTLKTETSRLSVFQTINQINNQAINFG